MRTGDTIHHRPSDETWLVAFVEDGKLCPCGWPDCLADVADCDLIRVCTDDESMELLTQMSKSSGRRGDYARRVLSEPKP